MRRIIIIHGWGGSPEKDWMPWAKSEFEKRGYDVLIPEMPDPDKPEMRAWVLRLASLLDLVDEDTVFIGHSVGCQTILRYLEGLPEGQKVGQVICVAGWFKLTGLEPEEEPIAKPWFDTPLDFKKIRNKVDSFVAIFSDNDPYVPYEENAKTYADKLGAEIILQQGMGHFSEDFGVTELPVLLELLEK